MDVISQSVTKGAGTAFARAALNYAGSGDGRREVEVEISDGRATRLPGWEVCGFELIAHSSSVTDWHDDQEIATVHYAELETLAQRLTGCHFALASDHVTRATSARSGRDQSPVMLVHSDFAANYEDVARAAYQGAHGRGAAALARRGRTADDVAGAGRILVMQFWRNLGASRMDYPLAFCDCQTLTPEETRPFRYTGYVAGGRSFDALAVLAPPAPSAHAWYTFPDMTPGEVVAFRTYDTELVDAGRTWFTPHSAFRDPGIEVGNPPRFSIEARVMCLFS
ncbi:MAG TPA: CmcJ/NvfI family oxidoreductase [Acidimicrobiales bacterium]|nr:CmcJ/NvfI family oxidoreductase [Acidimicrobiales bacterium]